MNEHIWHNIAYETSLHIDEDAMMWRWCSHCGAMGLGCEVYYIGGKKMTSVVDAGCPDVYTSLSDTAKKDKVPTMKLEKHRPGICAEDCGCPLPESEKVRPNVYVDPFDMPTDMK